jgi:Ca-activated chloride channel family protein
VSFLAGSKLWLLAVVAALAAAYVVLQGQRRRYAVRYTNLALLDRVAPRRPGWRRHLPAAALLLALATLVIATARPTRTVRVPRDRATIMVDIDVSLSMAANDVSPTRIEAAKSAADRFVDLLPARLNVGVVSFSGTAQVLVPPSTDRALVKSAIASLQLGQRTAIGEAIFASLTAIQAVPSSPGQGPPPARIVLLSDGSTTSGRSNDEAASAAADAHVPVFTIAFGTDHGTVDVDGRSVEVPVDKDALRAISQETNGQAFEASSAHELQAVYHGIGRSIGFRPEKREVTAWFVGLGLVFALAAAAMSLVWFARIP